MAAISHSTGLAGESLAVHEDTDLALLDQHLLKTNQLSKRMTSILSQLDSRLVRLDRSITRLGIRELSQQSSNIDAVLQSIEGRPPASRQGSYGTQPSIKGSVNGSYNESFRSATTATTPTGSQNDHKLSSSQTFGKISPNTPTARDGPSVMERKRTIPRADVAPRWQQSPSPAPSPRRELPKESPRDLRESHRELLEPSRETLRSQSPTPSRHSRHSLVPSRNSVVPTTGDERALLERGPDRMSIAEYFGAMETVIADMEHMYQGINEGRGGTRQAGVNELSDLLEKSYGQVVELVLKIARENVPRTFDPKTFAGSSPPPTSTYYPAVSSLKSMTTRLASVVNPETSGPMTMQRLAPILSDCIADLASIRGDWLRRSIAGYAARIEEAEATVWDGRGGDKVRIVMQLWESFVVAAEAESSLVNTLMPGEAGQRLIAQTLPYPMAVLTATMNQVVTGIKRSLSTQTMVLLDLYASLTTFQPRFESTLQSVLGPDAQDMVSALTSPLNTMRGLALRSFPERLMDIRAPVRNAGPTSQIDDNTHSTLAYLEALPSFGSLAETLLRSSGHAERSWLMGAAAPPSSARSAAEEGGVVNLYAADVLGTLLIHLKDRAKTMRRPVSSTFLLNNMSYIRNSTSSFNADIIGPGAEDMLNRNFREAKTQYVSEWMTLTQQLQHQAQTRFNVGSSHEKQSTKEASLAFFDRLAELEQQSRQFPLNRQDPDMRDRVANEVEELIRTAFSAWWNRAHSRGYDKYLKATPDEISRRIQNVFR